MLMLLIVLIEFVLRCRAGKVQLCPFRGVLCALARCVRVVVSRRLIRKGRSKKGVYVGKWGRG